MTDTLRDRMWIFAADVGLDDENLASGGVTQGSRMTPAEGAFCLDVPNLIMVRCRGLPTHPFEQYCVPFRPLKRLVWSIVGSGGKHEGDELPLVLDLAQRQANLSGVFLDDFFVRDPDDPSTFRGAYSPEELAALRDRLALPDRQLETWVTFYSRALDPTHPLHMKIDPPPEQYLEQLDVITLWTRGEDRLRNLERYLGQLEAMCPGPRKAIGCDFWDFQNKAAVPMPLMEMQCELCRKWIKEGRISDMIFLANTVMDVGLENVEWTRQWIQDVADEPLAAAVP